MMSSSLSFSVSGPSSGTQGESGGGGAGEEGGRQEGNW